MGPEVKVREYRIEVRRTEFTGSTRRIASRGQANNFLARVIISAIVSHCGQCTAVKDILSTAPKFG
jgi:hypothetical protein